MCLYMFFQKCGLVLVFLFLFVDWDMLLLEGMETTATNFRLSEIAWFSPPQKSPVSLFHSFSGKLTKCWFSYSLAFVSLRYLDDRNMSMRNLFFHLHSAMLKQLLMHFADSFLTLIPLLYFLRDPKQALFSAASITHQGHPMQTGIASEDQQHNLASLWLLDASGEQIPSVVEELVYRGK